jgi:hypothetical protein
LTFSWMIKPWFFTEGKFAIILIIPSSWGSQLGGYPARIRHNFLAPLLGKKKTSARGVSHAHPLLCFKFCFYFIFTCIVLSKTQKISILYSCYFFTFSSLCCSLSTFWRTSQ